MLHIGEKTSTDVLENLRSELRRGSLIIAVLAELAVEQYGYTLRKSLEDNGIAIDEGTLYPLLRRLESQGLLQSEWREQDKRNKRFYRLSSQGEETLELLLEDWEHLSAALQAILQRPAASASTGNSNPASRDEAPTEE
jgi:PadR family transcriptional regulator PadR